MNIIYTVYTCILISFFIKAKSYDERHFVSCEIYDNYGIGKSGKDQGVIAREKQSVKRAGMYKIVL